MSEPPLLEARRVTKRYDEVVALDEVSLSVADGECLALVGESGSGKTTLLRSFNRMIEPDSGTVLRGGHDLRTLDPILLRRQTGYVQQEGGLLPHWSTLRNAALVPTLREMDEPNRRGSQALDRVGLPAAEFGARKPSELSGGQRQRLAIARAIAGNPDVLLLDEPFGALDAITRGEVRDAFDELRRALKLTSVVVTHDISEAFALADRIAVFKAGVVQQVAAPSELRRAPAPGYVTRLLDRAGVGSGTAR